MPSPGVPLTSNELQATLSWHAMALKQYVALSGVHVAPNKLMRAIFLRGMQSTPVSIDGNGCVPLGLCPAPNRVAQCGSVLELVRTGARLKQ